MSRYAISSNRCMTNIVRVLSGSCVNARSRLSIRSLASISCSCSAAQCASRASFRGNVTTRHCCRRAASISKFRAMHKRKPRGLMRLDSCGLVAARRNTSCAISHANSGPTRLLRKQINPSRSWRKIVSSVCRAASPGRPDLQQLPRSGSASSVRLSGTCVLCMEPSHWRDQSSPQQMQGVKITSATPPFRLSPYSVRPPVHYRTSVNDGWRILSAQPSPSFRLRLIFLTKYQVLRNYCLRDSKNG